MRVSKEELIVKCHRGYVETRAKEEPEQAVWPRWEESGCPAAGGGYPAEMPLPPDMVLLDF